MGELRDRMERDLLIWTPELAHQNPDRLARGDSGELDLDRSRPTRP